MAKEAYEWYEEQKQGLGMEFLTELETCYGKIIKHPEQYGYLENGYRRIACKRFPYVVIYEVINADIVVFGVFHTRRNPDKRIKD